MLDQVTLTQKLDYGRFLRFKLIQYFLRPRIFVLYGLIAVILSTSLGMYPDTANSSYISVVAFILFFIILLPLVIILSVRRMYKSNHMIQAPITYTFSDQSLVLKGQYFTTTYQWEAIYMAEEYSKWLLIYTSLQTAIHLYKPEITDASDIEIIKQILKSKDHIYLKLKK